MKKNTTDTTDEPEKKIIHEDEVHKFESDGSVTIRKKSLSNQ